MNRIFTAFVVGAMVLGILVGWAINATLPAEGAKAVAENLSIITDVFLRLIKMIIAPLVFSTLVAGIAHMGDASEVGRVGVKTIGWFILASITSLTIGLIMVHLIHPGSGLSLTVAASEAAPTLDMSKFTLREFITHVVPSSIVDAMARNEILQIVVFSVLVGTAVSAVDDRAPAVLALVEQVAAIMLKVTGYVMRTAPLAIFAALSASIATQGLDVLVTYAKFVLGFYGSLALLWGLLVLVAVLIVGPRALKLMNQIRSPALLAFSTASSEAAYPRTLEELQKWGISRKVASFVLPLGYSFNLDGSMMYCTFAVMFIAQVYGVELSIGQQITMLLLLMVTSKGMAGVPRASLVVIAATLTFFDLPEAGLLLILAVDHLLDMGRSATNVIGNSVAAAVVAKWEGQIEEPSGEGAAT
ncbi:MAG: cation:dicarboxylase symporter family transporter [Phenylobacterium sp.]|uniref:dicarboxylate/amino acid:cation symporter n=1 Tax=Phenylobacterium sp. TaxID=1871053 RepID=UPI0025F51976|nr:dicarboxylate/amino acid:cation symporter [Phenylobacterium sp.]MBI1199921.1 cation:dicarboxylase symporter family transporter [Phenylobacterium sp.]